MAGMEGARLALVTGNIEVGKTTVVQQVVALARAQGYVCAGIWSPARVVGRQKVGIEAVDLRSGERRLLAQMAAKQASEQMGRYTFDPAVLAWANQVLAAAILARPDLLVVDEVGPLELEWGSGLSPVLEPLAAGRVSRALVVVRAWLLDALRTRLRGISTAIFTVDVETRESAPERVFEWLFE